MQSHAVPKFKDKFSIFHIYALKTREGPGFIQKGNVIDGDTYFKTVEALVSDYLGNLKTVVVTRTGMNSYNGPHCKTIEDGQISYKSF